MPNVLPRQPLTGSVLNNKSRKKKTGWKPESFKNGSESCYFLFYKTGCRQLILLSFDAVCANLSTLSNLLKL